MFLSPMRGITLLKIMVNVVVDVCNVGGGSRVAFCGAGGTSQVWIHSGDSF